MAVAVDGARESFSRSAHRTQLAVITTHGHGCLVYTEEKHCATFEEHRRCTRDDCMQEQTPAPHHHNGENRGAVASSQLNRNVGAQLEHTASVPNSDELYGQVD